MRPVVWSAAARQDYLDILRYFAADNPFSAENVVDAIEKAGNDLGGFATGRPGRVTGTYEKPVAHLPYIIAYALATQAGHESVVILRMIQGAWPGEEWPR